MKKLFRLIGVFLSMAATVVALQACQEEPVFENAPQDQLVIEGQYIVVLHDGAELKTTDRPDYETGMARARERAVDILDNHGISPARVQHVYEFVLRGFATSLTADEFQKLKGDERVAYIEPVKLVTTLNQTNATWGIDRVDQRALPLNQTYTWDGTGTGVRVYILDTGIRYNHTEFGTRASFGFDAFGGNGSDGNGHGTHVAGTVAGTTFGIAKNALLVSVRVLNNAGSGTTAGVIAGMDWVAANHIKPAVANMSLGGPASTATDDAVVRMFNAGVSVIVAAGNDNRDACGFSPARAANAISVGATASNDARSSFSNWGACVDIFAPGSSITSAWHNNRNASRTISGTSMAAPHVAGSAAIFLGNNPTATPTQVYNFLLTNSTKDIVTNSLTTNNDLLFTLGTR